MTSAIAAVFDTNELLEHIFTHLDDLEAIVGVQRVSRHWQALVDGSVRLQRILFYSTTPKPISPASFQPSGCARYDYALQINPCFAWDSQILSFSSKVGYVHNIIASQHLSIRTSARQEEDIVDPSPEFEGRMRQFFTQPACTTIQFRVMRSRKWTGPSFTSGSLYNKGGIKLSDVKYVVRLVWMQFQGTGLFRNFDAFIGDFVLDSEDMKTEWRWPACGDNDPDDQEFLLGKGESDDESDDEREDEVEDEEEFPDDWPAEFGIGVDY